MNPHPNNMEGKYIHRGGTDEMLERQRSAECGLSYPVSEDCTEMECYRICKRLNLCIGDSDSCELYDENEYSKLDFLHAVSLFGNIS